MKTYLTARTVRYETVHYELDGALTEEEAIEQIQEEGLDPTWSKIHSEDFDVTDFEVRSDAGHGS